MTYYVSIGNSDNKLTQSQWATFQQSVLKAVQVFSDQVHGVWYSLPTSMFQNMCICFEAYDRGRTGKLRSELRLLAREYKQDNIALATAQTEFIKGE